MTQTWAIYIPCYNMDTMVRP